MPTPATAENPFFAPWTGPFGAAPLDRIRPEHFAPAFARGFAEHQAEVAAIAANPADASFANTIEALELAGDLLRRTSEVFWNLTGADTNEALQAVERDVSPLLSRHWSGIYLDGALFRRIDAIHERRATLGLTPEQLRVLERYHLNFVRAGARLAPAAKQRVADISARLATLGTSFAQNVLADEKSFVMVLDGEQDLAGLPAGQRAAAARAAEERGHPGKHAITLGRSSVQPFLEASSRRDLREKAYRAWIARGENGGDSDNKAIVVETLQLRAERAKLLGYATYAQYSLDDTMARTPEAATALLDRVWAPALQRVGQEREALQQLVQDEGGNFALAAWDWRYYAEKLRAARYDLDPAELKPYLQLERMIEASFDTASRLFGLSFTERHDVPVYHPDVRVWEVKGRDGSHVALFIGDYFARPSKRSGAWMSAFREQHRLGGEVRPIIVNVCNFAKGGEGQPSLLSFDDARTLFHEFGHALHGMLSDVTYPSLSGTNVSRDFVELPSQIYEHWLSQPEVLQRFALHAETGQPMPAELLQRLLAAANFNQGFSTAEFIASAKVDMELHLLASADGLDVDAFEREALTRMQLPAEIAMRHRIPHFAHIFSGDGYSAGYYSYLWSEVLDADGFQAFKERGDIFDPETAARLHKYIYSAGNLREPSEAYRLFRGRDPEVEPLLVGRGLVAA